MASCPQAALDDHEDTVQLLARLTAIHTYIELEHVCRAGRTDLNRLQGQLSLLVAMATERARRIDKRKSSVKGPVVGSKAKYRHVPPPGSELTPCVS